MNNCKGKTKDNKKCKRKCKGKYCYQHKKSGGAVDPKDKYRIKDSVFNKGRKKYNPLSKFSKSTSPKAKQLSPKYISQAIGDYNIKKKGGLKQKKGRFTVESKSKSILVKKKGRFDVKKDFGNVNFEETVEVKKIRKNDCSKKNRPKLKRKKDNLKKGEIATYKKYCPKHQGNAYYTKNGFLCCQ